MSGTSTIPPDVTSDHAIAVAVDPGLATSPFVESLSLEAKVKENAKELQSREVDRSSPSVDSCWEGDPSLELDSNTMLDQQLSTRIHSAPSVKILEPSVVGSLPNEESIMVSRELLSQRISLYGLQEKMVKGDGNCQFRSISDQLYRSPKYHRRVRNMVVSQLKSDMNYFKSYIPELFDDYVRDMNQSGTWGDHVTLKAAADYYGVQICVLSSYNDHDEAIILVQPKARKSQRTLFLSFWAEIHYNSLYPDTVTLEEKKKFLGSVQLHKLLTFRFR